MVTRRNNQKHSQSAQFLLYLYYLSIGVIIFGVAGLYFISKQQISADQPSSNTLFSSDSLQTFVSSFFPWAVEISGGLAIIVIIYAGYLYVTSAGNVEQTNKAKEYIVGALSGLVFLVLAGLIYQTISI